MTDTSTEMRSVIVEREFAEQPEQVWRALTLPHLLEEWLMKNDFAPIVGHRFTVSAEWGSVDCRVMQVEPNRALSYSWEAFGVQTVVRWTLKPTRTGTQLRMEQTGFRPDQQQAYQGASAGWPQFLGKLEQVLARQP